MLENLTGQESEDSHLLAFVPPTGFHSALMYLLFTSALICMSVYIYISAYMPSCLYRTQSRQIRTFALAYRSLNQVKPGVSQGLRASVPRDLLPNIRRNANFTSVCVFNSFTQTPGYVESCSGQSHQIHLFPDLVPSAPNLLDTQ